MTINCNVICESAVYYYQLNQAGILWAGPRPQ